MSVTRFDFDWEPLYRRLALPFGITPRTAYAEVGPTMFRVRFGAWSLRTQLENLVGADVTGGYAVVKTAGPPHLSFTDRGVTFATNRHRGLCLSFARPVAGIDPTGLIRHPGATVTVADVEGLRAALGL